MKILLTNDDGYRANGILALFKALRADHDVILAAPDRERSAIGHGITLHHPLKYESVNLNGGGNGYAVSGTPADCVKLAVFDICKGLPDLVISGINAGSNTGVNINYSGTAGAAREAAINRIPALAVSIQHGDVMDFQGMAAYTASLLGKVMGLDLPKGVFLNINGPAIPIDRVAGVKITSQADNNLSTAFDKRIDPRNRTYFWYGNMETVVPGPNTDDSALLENSISITPIQCDMTAYAAMDVLNRAGFSIMAAYKSNASPAEQAFNTSRVSMVAFAHFVHDLYTSFLSPLLPLIIEKLSLTLSQAGLLSTVMQIPALANPFIGLFADNRGLARWLVILAPTLTAIPMSIMGLAPSYGLLLVLVFLSGISVALFHVPAPVLVARYSGPFKGRGMSFFMTGGELARTLGPMVAVAAVSLLGLARFHYVLVLALATSVLLFLTLEPADQQTVVKKSGSLRAVYKEIRHVLDPLTGILAGRAFMHGSMGMFLTVYVEQKTGSLWYGGTALALYEALGVAGVLSAGTLSDRLGRQRVLFWALLTAPVAILLFVYTSGVFQVLMLLFAGFSILSTTPVMLALIQETAGNNPSAANGLFMMVSFALRSLAVVVVGALGDAFGLDNMFVISALTGFTAVPFLIKLGK